MGKPDQESTVFVSYSRDDATHIARVKAFAAALEREGGLRITTDHLLADKEPGDGFAAWMANAIRAADHFVIVASHGYGSRSGARFELNMMQNLEFNEARQNRVTQVFLDPTDAGRRSVPYAELGSCVFNFAKSSENLSEAESWPVFVRRVKSTPGASRKDPIFIPAAALVHADPREDRNKATTDDGVVLVGDVVNFSSTADQTEILTQMWDFLRERLKRYGEKCLLDSTLDGAVIVFHHDRPHGKPWEEVALEVARDWLGFMNDGIEINGATVRIKFRIGAEFGAFSYLRLASPGGSAPHASEIKIIGKAPNDCDRLTRLGDAGDIIISESFFQSWKGHALHLADDHFRVHPPPDQAPVDVSPKPGRLQRVRVYTGHKRDGDPVTPLALRLVQAVALTFESLLEDICDDYRGQMARAVDELLHLPKRKRGSVAALKRAANRVAAQIRVSLFVRSPERENELICVRPRHLDPLPARSRRRGGAEPARRQWVEARTAYSLDEPGEGAVGRAFLSGGPLAVTGLPEVKRNSQTERKKYVAAAAQKQLVFQGETVANFQRFARTYLCFPCVFADLPPAGAVCVDAMNDASAIPQDTLDFMAGRLADYYGPLLALLLHTRP